MWHLHLYYCVLAAVMKIPEWVVLWTTEIYFLQFWRWKVGINMLSGQVSGETCFLVQFHRWYRLLPVSPHGEKMEELLGVSFKTTLILFIGPPPLWPNTIILKLTFQHVNFGSIWERKTTATTDYQRALSTHPLKSIFLKKIKVTDVSWTQIHDYDRIYGHMESVTWELEDKTQGHEVVGSVMTTFIHIILFKVHNVFKRQFLHLHVTD